MVRSSRHRAAARAEAIERGGTAPAVAEEQALEEQPPAAPVDIIVRTMAGEEMTMTVALSAPLSSLRRRISDIRGTPFWRTRLVLGSQVLDSDLAAIRDAGIGPGTRLDLVVTNPAPEEFNGIYERADGHLNGIEGHLFFRSDFQRLSDEEKATVICAVVSDDRVRKLTMEGVGLTDVDAEILVPVLEQSLWLLVINLSNNMIHDAGARLFAEAFERNRRVRELYLYGNPIGADGKQRLFEAKIAARQQQGRGPVLVCYSM